MIFARENLKDNWPEFMVLAELHWSETEMYRHDQPLHPDRRRYEYYEQIKAFHWYTARDEAGHLVGHCGMYVQPSMHSGELIATEDMWFLTKETRKGRNAIRFHQFVEADMRSLGCVEISMTVKLTNGAGRILEYLKYKHTASQYTKLLRT